MSCNRGFGTGDLVVDAHWTDIAGGHAYVFDFGGAIFAPAVRRESNPFPLSWCEFRKTSASTAIKVAVWKKRVQTSLRKGVL